MANDKPPRQSPCRDRIESESPMDDSSSVLTGVVSWDAECSGSSDPCVNPTKTGQVRFVVTTGRMYLAGSTMSVEMSGSSTDDPIMPMKMLILPKGTL